MRLLVYGGLHQLGAHVVVAARNVGNKVEVWDFSLADQARQQDVSDKSVHLINPAAEKDPSLAMSPPGLGEYDAVIFCGIDLYPDLVQAPPSEDRLAAERAVLARILEAAPGAVVLAGAGPGTAFHAHCEALEDAVSASGVRAMVLRCAPVVGMGPGITCVEHAPKVGLLLPGAKLVGGDLAAVDLEFGAAPTPNLPAPGCFVHATDAADACLRAASTLAEGGDHPLTLDICGPGAPPAEEVWAAVSGSEQVRVHGAPDLHATDTLSTMATDVASAHDALGWRPFYSYEDWLTSEVDALHAAWVERHTERKAVKVTHEYLGSFLSRSSLRFFGLFLVDDRTGTLRNSEIRLIIQKQVYRPRILTKRGIPLPLTRIRVSPYVAEVPLERIASFPSHSIPRLAAILPDGRLVRRHLVYSFLRRKARFLRGQLHRVAAGNSTLYMRQSGVNRLNITFRPRNRTDDFSLAPVIALAALAAKVAPTSTVLLFEKHRHYEESASVLFERLIDNGRRDVRFIIDRDRLDAVPPAYRQYLVVRYSFAHFYRFLCAKTLLGTETAMHATERLTANRILQRRIFSGRFSYVFLQHGVMYMVALSSALRREFRAGGIFFPPNTKIVCSSQKEARHFIELGDFDPENLYVSGLPKFDRAVRDEDADLILIMPTWRPWEHNIVRTAPHEAPYFKMLVALYEAMPAELKDKVRILPHPLMRDAIAATPLAERMWSGGSHDEALRKCAVLVTDYSSISYDAYYRGAGVVFWWRDKDECMRQYQGHLMLDDDSAFGPVCNELDDVTKAVSSLYAGNRDFEYARRYRQLVEFHDNGNTDRLLAMLEKDGLI